MGNFVGVMAGEKKNVKKRRQIRIYLDDENESRFNRLHQMFPDLEDSEITRMLVYACLRAVNEVDYRWDPPLAFSIRNPSTNDKKR